MDETDALKKRLAETEEKLQKSQQKLKNVENELASFKASAASNPNNSDKPSNRYSDDFWVDVWNKLKTDTDAIKAMMNDGTITKNDIDQYEMSLLTQAAYYGNYEIAKLCVNKGYSLKAKDSPLERADNMGHHDIAQLLRLAEIKGNVGD